MQKYLDQFVPPKLKVNPRKITLVVDCTFFRGRGDKDGLMIFLDAITREVVWFKFIESETKVRSGGLGLPD